MILLLLFIQMMLVNNYKIRRTFSLTTFIELWIDYWLCFLGSFASSWLLTLSYYARKLAMFSIKLKKWWVSTLKNQKTIYKSLTKLSIWVSKIILSGPLCEICKVWSEILSIKKRGSKINAKPNNSISFLWICLSRFSKRSTK